MSAHARARVACLLFALAGAVARADDVGNTPATAEPAGPGARTRALETLADRDVFQFTVMPYVTNLLAVSTGTVWDCEVDLLTPSGAGVVFVTNTAAGAAAPVIILSTTVAYRAYVQVRSLAEYTTGTYTLALTATFQDADGDGLPDQWELARLGTTTNAPGGDADADGASNHAEYMTGTDPASAASALEITGVAVVSNMTVVTWQTVPQGLYRVSESAGPAGAWTVLADGVLAGSNEAALVDTVSSNLSVYRVELRY
jgi:hypothetical protein